MDDMNTIREQCLRCEKCGLCATRRNVVFGVGPTDAEIMLIGEGPGQQEDLTGEPFVGPAGQLLDRMLSIIGLDRQNCYIANIVKCRPPQNRDPLPEEQQACLPWLHEQIKFIRPKIIVCLGRISAMQFIRDDFRISKEHGHWTEIDGVWYTALFHPSALLRDESHRPDTFRDLKALQEKAHQICTHTAFRR